MVKVKVREFYQLRLRHTVDGRNPKNNHLGRCIKPCKYWDKLPFPQLVSLPDSSKINSINPQIDIPSLLFLGFPYIFPPSLSQAITTKVTSLRRCAFDRCANGGMMESFHAGVVREHGERLPGN